MTLKAYEPEMLDQFALRLLDLAAILRDMANRSRQYGIKGNPLHDKKAVEWCDNLEHWAHKAQAEMELRIIDARATRRARSARSK